MLRPNKHSHPDKTIVSIAYLMLARLKKKRLEGYDALRRHMRKTIPGSDYLFLPALNFLYLLGLIDYRGKTDSIEYVGPNEAIEAIHQ